MATWRPVPSAVLAVSALVGAPGPDGAGEIVVRPFGKTAAGERVELYTLKSNTGVEAAIMNLGGILVSLKLPDRGGTLGDVVLGFDDLTGYLSGHPYFGAIIGRYANRIGHGRFTLNGQRHVLTRNDGDNTLHGGARGFDKVLWQARPSASPGAPSLELQYLSRDGEEGFPGNLAVRVSYALAGSELRIDYEATTDQDTVVNLTQHSYFNLAGQGEGDILGHLLWLDADRFTPVDEHLIPTGELLPVAGTPFDFRAPTPIGARIGAADEQLRRGGGYDHNFVLTSPAGALRLVARLSEPRSGRVVELLTSEPGLQLYTGNFLDGRLTGKAGKVYRHRSALCLEAQHFPDSPNEPAFPTTVLRRGERFRSTTVYRFATAPAP